MTTLEDIKDRLNQDPTSALTWLMPNGRMIRHQFCCGDVFGKAPSPKKDGSFKFNCKKLVGKDYASGDRGLRGIYDVFVAYSDGNQTEAIKLARDFLKLPVSERPQAVQGHEHGRRRRGDGPETPIEVIEVITPAPETSPTIPERHRHAVKGIWPWRKASGEILGYSYRLEFKDQETGEFKKIPLPLTWCKLRNKKTGQQWEAWHNAGLPQPQPLFDAPALLQASRILLVEGETTREAAQAMIARQTGPLAGFDMATTWYGGVERIAHVDWSPLTSQSNTPKVVIGWPDADDVNSKLYRPGMLAMEKIGKLLSQLSPWPEFYVADPQRTWRSVSEVPLPKGWDLADPIPAPGTDAWITETITTVERYL